MRDRAWSKIPQAYGRTNDGTPRVSDSAQHHHHQNHDRTIEPDLLRIDEERVVRVEPTSVARNRCAKCKGLKYSRAAPRRVCPAALGGLLEAARMLCHLNEMEF